MSTTSVIKTSQTGPVVRATPSTRPAAMASHHAARGALGSEAASSATHQAMPAAVSAPLVLIDDITSTDVGAIASAIATTESGPGRARTASNSVPSSNSAASNVKVNRPSSKAAVVVVA